VIQAIYRQHLYFYSEEETIFDVASTKCQLWYGELASATDEEEANFLQGCHLKQNILVHTPKESFSQLPYFL
jgi:hypothetical protein